MGSNKERGGQLIFRLRQFMWWYKMPVVLLYGASHIIRLQDWLAMGKDSRYPLKLTYIDTRAFSNATFCAVGGSRFATIHQRVCGQNVTAHQPKRGNQWQETN